MTFWFGVLTLVCVHVLAGTGAAMLQMRLRLISIAHGAVLGTGAYTFAMLNQAGWSFGLAALAGACAGAVAGVLCVLLAERVVGEDFALASFAIQVVWTNLVMNAGLLTGGVLGISGIEGLPLSGHIDGASASILWLAVLVAIQLCLLWHFRRSAFWSACAAVARSSELASSLGISSLVVRAQLGLFYGIWLGSAGVVLAAYLTFIDPRLFATHLSVVVLGVAFVGAFSRWLGPAIGAMLIVGLPQLLRFLDIPMSRVAYFQAALAGLFVMIGAVLLIRAGRLAHGIQR